MFELFLGTCVKRAFLREQPIVIGVAGSVGKSSTRSAIGIALGADEEGSRVVASEKNYNNELGLPLAVFGCLAPHRSPMRWLKLLYIAGLTGIGILRLRARIFVLEMATDKPGDLAYLVNIAKPTIGVLTAIGPEHTEFFGTVDAVAQEEAAILSMLGPDGVAVINADDTHVRDIAALYKNRQLSFGTSDGATVRVNKATIAVDMSGTSGLEIEISMCGNTIHLFLSGTIGRPQALAAAAAIAVAFALDQDERQACQRLRESFHGLAGRMRLIEGIKRTWIIDDTYNSSPLAALSAIRDLASMPIEEGGKRIAALGDMLELGDLSDEAHREMGRAIVENRIDLLVTCGTLAHIAAQAAIEAGMAQSAVFTFADSAAAGLFIQEHLRQHDIVLVKGSQGVRMERVVKELMAYPDRAGELLVRQESDWLARK